MNLLFSCIGKRGYIADAFRAVLGPGDRIIATSNTPWTPGFASCDRGVLMPDIASDEYLPAVRKLCQDEAIDAIVSFFDPDVHRLASYHGPLREIGVTPILPTFEAADICFDKFKTFQFLKEHRFPTPETFVDLESVYTALDNRNLNFPLVVKPRSGFGSAHTNVARNTRELEVFFRLGPPMIVQPKAVGEDYNFDICNDLAGRTVAVVLWRKLRSTLGETEQVVTCRNDALLEFGVRLGETVGSIGPMDVDMIVDEDGKPSIIELNPRFGGGYPVSHLAGADFPALIVRMLRGETIEPQIGQYRDDIVMMKLLSAVGGPANEFWTNTLRIHDARPSDAAR